MQLDIDVNYIAIEEELRKVDICHKKEEVSTRTLQKAIQVVG